MRSIVTHDTFHAARLHANSRRRKSRESVLSHKFEIYDEIIMKLLVFVLAATASFALAGRIRPNPLRERGMELSHPRNKEAGSHRSHGNEFAIWDECVYMTEKVESASGRYKQTRHQCQLPTHDYAHQNIASFHIQPAMRSDRDSFWCYESWGKHPDLPEDDSIYHVISCDSRMDEGYAIVHMLCCACEEYVSEPFGKQLSNGTVFNANGSIHEFPIGKYELAVEAFG